MTKGNEKHVKFILETCCENEWKQMRYTLKNKINIRQKINF